MTNRMTRWACVITLATMALPSVAQEEKGPAGDARKPAAPPRAQKFRFSAELKSNFRHSTPEQFKLSFPFPANFIPPGEDGVFMRTAAPGSSAEISNVALVAEADLTRDISAKVRVHFLDLYNRNPISTDDRVFIREAWVRFGASTTGLESIPGTTFFVLAGKAPRFSRQEKRRLESYGLWGTAVGRFEEVQLQVGGTFGRHITWRASAASPNALFFRDPNALAGDNGTPDRAPGNVHPVYQSGFPILYDSKAQDLTFGGKFQFGGGLGLHFVSENGEREMDALAWVFRRDLLDSVPIRGSFYSGDLKLLQAFAPMGIGFDVRGREKLEYGVNVEARLHDAHLFAQYVRQKIAGLERHGFEAELGYSISLNGLFLSGETPVLNWIEPAVRYSEITNSFVTSPLYPAPSVGWDWRKVDIGVRIGIIQGLDLTAEYSRNDVFLFSGGKLHPDETLVTLHAAF